MVHLRNFEHSPTAIDTSFTDRMSPFWYPTIHARTHTHTHTHTHTRLMALCPGLPRWAATRKVKPIWILLEQETVSSSSISWAICKSATRSRQITTPAPHYSSFLQAGCPSCRPTNSVKALKARYTTNSVKPIKRKIIALCVGWC